MTKDVKSVHLNDNVKEEVLKNCLIIYVRECIMNCEIGIIIIHRE